MFLIVTAGEPPSKGLLSRKASQAECIIAADRGAEYCLDAGVIPHLVVGDMDSLDEGVLPRLDASGAVIKRFSTDKDQTDTEIALIEALQRGARVVEILGALGDRFDHALANVHLLRMALRHGIQARITSDTQQIFLVDAETRLERCRGCTVSFLPLTEKVQGITLRGFVYELDDACMEIGKPFGVSNRVKSAKAWVMVKEGVLLAVLATGGGDENLG
ncbi:MAG TPA: thiamine diphosphokinase [Desulfomonilia bacterium]|nr:thiamine diphosphokinase [Desulfomonilia bacterium]